MLVIVMHHRRDYLQRLIPIVRFHGAIQALLLEEPELGVSLANTCDEFIYSSTQVTEEYDKALIALLERPEAAKPMIEHIQQDVHLKANNLNEKGFVCMLPFKQLHDLGLNKDVLLTGPKAQRAWISDYLMSHHICLDLQAQNSTQAIHELAQKLRDHPQISDFECFVNDVMAREQIKATGLGDGIAIPHAMSASVSNFVIAFGRSQPGIKGFSATDNKPVHLVFLIGTNSEAKLDSHVAMLARVSTMLKQESIRNELMQAAVPEDVVQLFVKARPKSFGIDSCFGQPLTV